MLGLVTVVGGSGFVGRYVVQELAAAGARIRVAARRPERANHLKPLGGVGQIQFVAADVRDPRAMAAAMHGADAAVNLVGILAEVGGRSFESVQARGAGVVARAAADAGARAFVQVSAIGADAASPSAYARSKAEGEAMVRAVFPRATVLRPSLIFGPEDAFINRFAGLARRSPVMPVVAGNTRFQPVYALDVAHAVVVSLGDDDRFGGRTFELGGPTVYSFRQIIAYILREIRSTTPMVEVPALAARLMGLAGDYLPMLPMTSDQYRLLQRDNVVGDDVPGLDALDVAATPMEAIAPGYLQRYRRFGRFNDTRDEPVSD